MTEDKLNALEAIEAAGLTITSVFVPFSRSRNAKDKQSCLNWKVTVLCKGKPFMEMDYQAGSGHCPAYKKLSPMRKMQFLVNDSELIRWECEHGREGTHNSWGIGNRGNNPILPDVCDVVASLLLDGSAIDRSSFEDWACDFGYDTDSRKAESCYRACLDIGLRLRAVLGDDTLTKLREALANH